MQPLVKALFRFLRFILATLFVATGVFSVLPVLANGEFSFGASSPSAHPRRSAEAYTMPDCSTRQLAADGAVSGQTAHVVFRVKDGMSCQSEVSGVTYDMPDVKDWPQHRRAIAIGHVSPGNLFVVDLELGPCRWQWDAIRGSDAPETLTGLYFNPHGTTLRSGSGGQPCQRTETPTTTSTPTSTPTPTATSTSTPTDTPTSTPTNTPTSTSTPSATPTGSPNCVQPPAGMVGWWPGDGSGADIVGGHDGTPRNGATFASGLVGQAFSLDGANAFVEIPDSPSFTLSSITIDGWVKSNNVVGTLHPIVTKYNASLPNGASWSLLGATNGDLVFAVYQSVFVFRAIESNAVVLTPGAWQHIAATFDGNTQAITLYVNGMAIPSTLIAGSTSVAIADSAASVDVGTLINERGELNGLWDGLADEVEIFNRALSASEIQAIYQAGSAGKCRSPIPALPTATPTYAPPVAGGPLDEKIYLPLMLQYP